MIIIINYVFLINENFNLNDKSQEYLYKEKNKKIADIIHKYSEKSKQLDIYRNDAKLAHLFINSLKNENLVNRYLFKFLQKLKMNQ